MWLLENNIRQIMQQARTSGVSSNVEQQALYQAQHISSLSVDNARLLNIVGNTAEITIKGVMTNEPDFLAILFGGGNVVYSEIVSAFIEAENNSTVKDINLIIDSPGGTVDGLFNTLNVINAVNKPIIALVSNMAASAGFAITSQADKIIATNKAVMFGSVGVAVDVKLPDNTISISSTNSPKKRPDVSTEQGKAFVREELDAVHKLFVDSIAQGRNTSTKKVNANFGEGGMLLAEEALKRGMIDSIIGEESINTLVNTKSTTAVSGKQLKVNIMDLNDLKVQHPGVYLAAVNEGVANERDRVVAHLTMGDASGDFKTAATAIKDGSEMTATLQAAYMSAGMNRKDIKNRDGDDVNASAGDGVSDFSESGNEVIAIVEANLGIDGGS